MSQQIRDQLQATLGTAYTLERELGGGGMSKVFVAEEMRLKRKVVVKLLSPELAQGISIERFEREIQTAAALQQANIVPVLSAGDTNGLPFYTMPFVTGESLRARLGRGPLAISDVVSVLRDVSRALAFAHAQGVVHRDIKPDNVLLSGGAAVVTDFGIAKAISAARTQSGGATLTQIGTSIGTPAYMAPEQAAGDPTVDHRADVYSLGAMAYELLTGQVVFADRTPQRMLAAHMSEAPRPVTELRPDTPAALSDLVMRCLAKEAAQRPQDATEILRSLEATSGGGMTAAPAVLLGGAGMFRKALAIYAAAFVVVAIVAKAAIVGIGLPDWVFPGSLIVMALGLPVVLWTGYVQRVARRAWTATPTFTPGGSPGAAQHGTIATMALRAAPHVSWYRTARGGMYALGVFIAMIAAFMGMRAFGIGPFGSLIATGALTGRDRLIITDFAVSNSDSTLGRVVGDAIRAGLGDSRVFVMLSPAEIGSALQRMQRDVSSRVDLKTAQQIALREGVKAIVDGDVSVVGTSYIVAVRLVTADSARALAEFHGTASSSDEIINVADNLSRKLREKAGESLRRVQATPALAYASTSSLEALRKYSDAARANDAERDYAKAIRLLREAVALDSNFAEGWRKLAVAIRNQGGYAPSVSDSAIRRAFALSDRMTERERDAVLGYYYQFSPGYDRAKAIAAYERMLGRGDSSVALINLGVLYGGRREFAKAESLYRTSARFQPGNQTSYSNLFNALESQGRLDAADSVIAVGRERFPGATSFNQDAITVVADRGRLDEARAALDSALKVGDRRAPSWAAGNLAFASDILGRHRDHLMYHNQQRALDSASGRPYPRVFQLIDVLTSRVDAGLPIDDLLKETDRAVDALHIESTPVINRPYPLLAAGYAHAGQAERARQFLSSYNTAVRDTARRRWDLPAVQRAQAEIAVTEKKWAEAVDLFRKSDRRPDGPVDGDDAALPMSLIRTFATAGMADSAIAVYEEYRKTPWGGRIRQGPDISVPGGLLEALAKMYDARGNTARAEEMYRDFVELWKNADPELQPRVAAARARLRQLEATEKKG
ncbi:MAG: protein kinase [Gemmatimonadota bacterium]|nr:protein kinase [Gemmatimonadota bacterium]